MQLFSLFNAIRSENWPRRPKPSHGAPANDADFRVTMDRRNREGSNSAIRVTPLSALNQRPLLEEERKTSARAEYFSVLTQSRHSHVKRGPRSPVKNVRIKRR
jgi:hypothetical protein